MRFAALIFSALLPLLAFADQQHINYGTYPNDHTGDTPYQAWKKQEANNTELFNRWSLIGTNESAYTKGLKILGTPAAWLNSLTGIPSTNGQAFGLTVDGNTTNTAATPSAVAVYDSARRLTNSPVTSSELGTLSGIQSSVQAQLNSKLTSSSLDTNYFLTSGAIQISDIASSASALYARALSQIGSVPRGALDSAISAIGKGSINVTLVGDSITESPGPVVETTQTDQYSQRLYAFLTNALPGVTVNWYNRALGQRRIDHFANTNYLATGTSDPGNIESGFGRSWSTTNGVSWIDYVKATSPDLLIVAFGMNLSHYTNGTNLAYESQSSDWQYQQNLDAIQAQINTWAKKPSEVFIPTILPTTNKASYGQSEYLTQAVARSIRRWAQNRGYAVADANRLFRIVRDGVDDVDRYSYVESGFGDYPAAWNSTGANTSVFQVVSGNLNSILGLYGKVARTNLFYNGKVSWPLTPLVSGGHSYLLYRFNLGISPDLAANDLGGFVIVVTANNGATLGNVTVYFGDNYLNPSFVGVGGPATVDWPTNATHTISVDCQDENHVLYLDGNQIAGFTTFYGMQDGLVGVQVPSVSDQFNVGSGFQIITRKPMGNSVPLLTQARIFSGDAYTGGNTLNHPNSYSQSTIYAAALEPIIGKLCQIQPEVSCKLEIHANQTNIDSAAHLMNWSTVKWDPTSMFDSTNKITIKTPGRYSIAAMLAYTYNTSGVRAAAIYKNGSQVVSQYLNPDSSYGTCNPLVTWVDDCVAGDYWQIYGSSTVTNQDVTSPSYFFVQRLR